jgi:hypothetical protein
MSINKRLFPDSVVSDPKVGHVELVRRILRAAVGQDLPLGKGAGDRRIWAGLGMSLRERDEAARALADAGEARFVVKTHLLSEGLGDLEIRHELSLSLTVPPEGQNNP